MDRLLLMAATTMPCLQLRCIAAHLPLWTHLWTMRARRCLHVASTHPRFSG